MFVPNNPPAELTEADLYNRAKDIARRIIINEYELTEWLRRTSGNIIQRFQQQIRTEDQVDIRPILKILGDMHEEFQQVTSMTLETTIDHWKTYLVNLYNADDASMASRLCNSQMSQPLPDYCMTMIGSFLPPTKIEIDKELIQVLLQDLIIDTLENNLILHFNFEGPYAQISTANNDPRDILAQIEKYVDTYNKRARKEPRRKPLPADMTIPGYVVTFTVELAPVSGGKRSRRAKINASKLKSSKKNRRKIKSSKTNRTKINRTKINRTKINRTKRVRTRKFSRK
jgi:hypothetical protein